MSIFLWLSVCAFAQTEISIRPATGGLGFLTHPYQAGTVPPIRLDNSSRLASLLRAGNLYLTAQDVVALAIENNIDVEIQRYGPLLQKEVLLRAQGGGVLRSVGLPVAAGPQSVSLQGISANTTSTLSAGTGVSSGGGIVTQLGPPIPTLDPSFVGIASFAHSSTPQSNIVATGVPTLITSTRSYQAQYIQTFDFGLNAQLTYASRYTRVNSPDYNLNPFTSGFVDLLLTQNLLYGFGRAVNDRNIRVQKNNVKVSDLQFKQQVMTTVSAALNLYWDLVSFNEDVRARRREVATAQQLLEDNKKLVEFGTAAPIEITRAESQLYASQQDLVTAETNLLQQETVLKNALSRNGVASAGLTSVHLVPLDKIEVPDRDEIRPLEDLIQEALIKRPEMAQARLNLESNQMNLVGIKNELKPTLQAFTELTNNGLVGQITGTPFATGGYGDLLSEIARRNYPNYSAGISLNIPLRNRAAQADYATSMLELRQNELNLRKNVNQIHVDVQNALIGLQQARARYAASVKSRVLQEETLAGDQKRYRLGATVSFQVVQDQRDLATAQSAEVQSMANYTHARISLDQALGATLEVNRISVDEALHGRLSQTSTLPAELPREERQ
ncbi:MAG: TolC family protein [Bryobacteraceae bacterium]